jgi:uncharacterized protein (TIGR00290 family)
MRVAVSWSGGKDSSLACYKAMTGGYDVAFIITFLWETPILSHPLSLIPLQSKALGLRHVEAKVKEPYFEQYRETISRLKEKDGIEGIVTGDISFIDTFHGNWMDDVCKGLGVKVIKPLWGMERNKILDVLVSEGFKAVFTCVKKPWFDEEWLGRIIDKACIRDLETLNVKYGMDICGEMGEYHTMILDAPIFREVIEIPKFDKARENSVFFLKPTQFFLRPKQQQAV